MSALSIQLRKLLKLTKKDLEKKNKVLSQIVLAEWSALARKRLKTTKQAYLSSLQIRDLTPDGFICGLPADASTAKIALIVELGMGPSGIGSQGRYDVRKFLLRDTTRNIRKDKKGNLYLNVPFSHTAKSLQAYGGNIYTQARSLAHTVSTSRGTTYGGRMDLGTVPKLKPHHVVDPLAGMVRLGSTYSKQGGTPVIQTSGYRTWRRASYANKDPQAWISKGVKAHKIADLVAKELPTLISQVY